MGLHVYTLLLLNIIRLASLTTIKREYIDVPNNKIDVGFHRLDRNGDGVVALDEFSRLIGTDDKNGDGCVSQTEYEDGAETAHALSDLMFAYLTGGADCLTSSIMAREFSKADKDGEGHVTMSEWESYFRQLMKQLFGQTAIVG